MMIGVSYLFLICGVVAGKQNIYMDDTDVGMRASPCTAIIRCLFLLIWICNSAAMMCHVFVVHAQVAWRYYEMICNQIFLPKL